MKSTQWKVLILGLVLTACNNNYKLDTATPGSTSQSTDGTGSGGTTPGGGGTTGTCTIQNVTQNLRILFMVDDSDSTNTTDPSNSKRVTTIQNFLNTYASKTNLTYSYNFFGTNPSTYSTSSHAFGNTTSANIFGTVADMAGSSNSALNEFLTIGSVGNTNYSAAFTRMQSIIQGDMLNNANENYVVVFMSDGQPTDQGSSANSQISGITSITSSLMGLAASGRITVSTVYFGAPDSQAQNNLSTMATLGSGQFVNTNVTTNFSIDNLITVPVQACN
jgi:hypothetical protein